MPKVVDHHARRIQIAEALMRVAASDGLLAVSLRHVASEAGVTAGMVQHYFGTKDEMMVFALGAVREKVQARLTAELRSASDGAPSARSMVRTLLQGMLPVDEERRREGHVTLAFYAYAAVRPDLANHQRVDTDRLRGVLSGWIRQAWAAGDAAAADPDRAAGTLLALVEGLTLQVLGQGYDPADAIATVDDQLGLIFPGQAI